MNDLHPPCEPWAEAISLAAAGCLPPAEEGEVRQHLETCPGCRERFRQLTELCGVLGEARLPADLAQAVIVERVMSAIACDESQDPLVRTRREMIHPTLLTRSLPLWRWIMRSPVSRVAAALFLLIITGVALWFHGGGATPAAADFIQPILDAKSAKFNMTCQVEGQPLIAFRVLFSAPNRMRQELPGGTVNISDTDQGKMVSLDPKNKRMTVFNLANMAKGKAPTNFFSQLRSQLSDAQKKPGVQHTPLGEKEIGGRRAVGYRISGQAQVITLWGDPKTGLPIRVETRVDLIPKATTTWTDFEFNVPVDESLFSTEPPAGYTVVETPVDVSPPTESDLIATFRQYSDMVGGAFPDALDTPSTRRFVEKLTAKLGPKQQQEPSPQQQREMMATILKLNRGLVFALTQPIDSDAHYAGKGVKQGEADRPIFWYRPNDSKKYRVIYADLSVREAETAPSVRKAQPVPASSGPKK